MSQSKDGRLVLSIVPNTGRRRPLSNQIVNLKINNEGRDRSSLQQNMHYLLAHGVAPDGCNHRSLRANFTVLPQLTAGACNSATYGHTEEETVEFACVLIDAGVDVNALADQLQSIPLGWRHSVVIVG